MSKFASTNPKLQPRAARLIKTLFKGDGAPVVFRDPAKGQVYLKCACCVHPVAEIEGDTLILISRHNGHTHKTRLQIVAIGEVVEAEREQKFKRAAERVFTEDREVLARLAD